MLTNFMETLLKDLNDKLFYENICIHVLQKQQQPSLSL